MRRNLIQFWTYSDPIYFQCTRLTYIKESTNDFQNIFRVRLTSYQGKDITLADGTSITKNDTLIKIHLHNIRLINETYDISSEIRKGRHIYQTVQASLPGLAAYVRDHVKHEQIKGIIGITVLNHKICRRLGFETYAISNPAYKWFKQVIFSTINKLATNTSSLHKLKQEPMYLFMSKQKLLSAYKK
ncbi:hypothetical protein ERJ70_06045 [Sediminibacillus dalangtanensis]|uniref:YkoP-like domain-containing protein n=1 Tax=Sediminibacillus dalangtanensis TaxID=2729421 RepID=A0ABX7VQW9_9BACI|nr:hypothetical protein [Sediminibacillus dalangtanensis]QTM98898.1 hypothetical protein ERJ70_06045 [Sediminibacillus dalangtanensis]